MFIVLCLLCFVSVYSFVQGDQKYYREDYNYVESFESFFRIHTLHSTWSDADRICSAEGASLFYPKTVGEAMEFLRLLLILNRTQSSNLTIISNWLSKEINDTFEGIPISELYSNWGPAPSENNKYPFICKKSYDSFVWNEECNLPMSDYVYSEVTNRCYKFHLDPKNWTDAYDICKQEQSYLAIMNSYLESRTLMKLTEGMPKEGIMGDYISGIAHLGFLNKNKAGWKTIDGIKLEDSGYSHWNHGQPDGPGRDVEELCGSMFYNGELNDIGCQIRCFFICEHEIKTMSTLRGYRLENKRK